jgi:hypothetical protein
MPREVRAFACAFRCGRGVLTAWKAMARHETTCASNPTRRACRTCKHDGREPYEPDTGAGGEWCDIDKRTEGVRMVVQCEHWESTVTVQDAGPRAGAEGSEA